MPQDFTIVPERDGDDPAVETLNEIAFGPGRFARTAYRIRERAPRRPALAFVALKERELIGSVRLTKVTIGGAPALLLGPLAVHPHYAKQGAGAGLMRASLEAARQGGYPLVVLVGDEPYYGRFGFVRAPRGRIRFPGPVDPDRILVAELEPGAMDAIDGEIEAVPPASHELSTAEKSEAAAG